MYATVSSEQPTEEFIERNGTIALAWQYLLHTEGAVDFELIREGLVILDYHCSGEPVAIIEEPRLQNRTLGGEVTFIPTERGNVFKHDAEHLNRLNLSIEADNEHTHTREVGQASDGKPLIEVYQWRPRLASYATIPANPLIGIGRNGET